MEAALRVLDDVVLRATGEDVRAWLGGQVTNDLRAMREGSAVYTLVLTTKGKILCDAWVLERGRDVLVVVPRSAADAVRDHFDAHIVMEDVALERTDLEVVTLQGPKAAEVVEAGGMSSFPCDRLGIGGRDVLVVPSEREPACAALRAAGAIDIDDPAWERARIELGRPRFGADFGEQHYPQEAGLKKLAVSFEKGCYLGQEVVCMLENRGQLTRRLVQLAGTASAGDVLSQDGAEVGKVTSATEGRALGYVKRAAAKPGARLGAPRGELEIIAIVGESDAGLENGAAL
jgi:folate-binding protein YgfZ